MCVQPQQKSQSAHPCPPPSIVLRVCAVHGHRKETNYRETNISVSRTVDYNTHILEYKYGNLVYKAGIGQKLGGQK